MGKLTAKAVAAITKKGRYYDGDNLALQVGPTGAKSWLFLYMLNRRSRAMGLGPVSLISLAEAREKALNNRRLLLDGIDPIEHRDAARARVDVPIFRTFAEEWIKTQEPGWRSSRSAAQWRSSLKIYAYPHIGDLRVDAITTDDVMSVIQPIWAEKPETAGRVRTRIAAILDAATARNFRDGSNPAEWKSRLKHLLPSQKRVHFPKPHGALPFSEMPKLMSELRDRESISVRALEFCILTAARTSEVTNATWDEINFKTRMWTIPASRTKQGREHRVPLTDRAVEILKGLPKEDDNPYVFISAARYRKPLSNMAMLEAIRQLRGHGITVHGSARSGFRTWATEAGHPRELAEAQLGHVIGDATERSYARGDMFARRKVMMEAWADYLARPTASGNVLRMPRQKKAKA